MSDRRIAAPATVTSSLALNNHDLRRQYSAGSPHQRRTDQLVRRITIVVGAVLFTVGIISLYTLFGLRIGRVW